MSEKPVRLKVYDQPHQFEPLLPQRALDELALQTRGVVEKAHQLQGAAHPATRERVRALVRSMNSYYSNLIEGQSTHPVNIERAQRGEFSAKPDLAQSQRMAMRHTDAEKEREGRAPGVVRARGGDEEGVPVARLGGLA